MVRKPTPSAPPSKPLHPGIAPDQPKPPFEVSCLYQPRPPQTPYFFPHYQVLHRRPSVSDPASICVTPLSGFTNPLSRTHSRSYTSTRARTKPTIAGTRHTMAASLVFTLHNYAREHELQRVATWEFPASMPDPSARWIM